MPITSPLRVYSHIHLETTLQIIDIGITEKTLSAHEAWQLLEEARNKFSLDFPIEPHESFESFECFSRTPQTLRKDSYRLKIKSFELRIDLLKTEELLADLKKTFREEDSWENVESKLESIKTRLRAFKTSYSSYNPKILGYIPEHLINQKYTSIEKRLNELDALIKTLKNNYVKPLYSFLEGSMLCDRYLFSQRTSCATATAISAPISRLSQPLIDSQRIELSLFRRAPLSITSPQSPKPL